MASPLQEENQSSDKGSSSLGGAQRIVDVMLSYQPEEGTIAGTVVVNIKVRPSAGSDSGHTCLSTLLLCQKLYARRYVWSFIESFSHVDIVKLCIRAQKFLPKRSSILR